MSPRIRWVVALKPEAQAVIESFRLKRLSATDFPVFASGDRRIQLVISGIGKANVAAATAFLASLDEKAVTGWINFGISGSGEREYGEAFLASKVEESDQEVWYPPAVWPRKHDLPRRVVRTVGEPCRDYPGEGVLVEMEASGFYSTAMRFSTSELCQVLKVVSDDPDHSIDSISKAQVTTLCREAISQASQWLEAFESVVVEEQHRKADPAGFSQLLNQFHFSATQKHQLRRLLQLGVSLSGSDFEDALSQAAGVRDGRACLEFLRVEVDTMQHSLSAGSKSTEPRTEL